MPAGTVQLAEQRLATRIDVSPAEAREVMARLLEQFGSGGRDVVGPVDFMEYCDRFGRKRGWVSGQVARMVAEGRLTETADTGRYRIVPRLATASWP